MISYLASGVSIPAIHLTSTEIEMIIIFILGFIVGKKF